MIISHSWLEGLHWRIEIKRGGVLYYEKDGSSVYPGIAKFISNNNYFKQKKAA
jgi:hypothetical protein